MKMARWDGAVEEAVWRTDDIVNMMKSHRSFGVLKKSQEIGGNVLDIYNAFLIYVSAPVT
jgi:hypothetical protein